MSVKSGNFGYAGEREVCGEIEAYMIRTEDKAGVKKYLILLDEQGLDAQKSASTHAFREIDRARHVLEMALGEPGYIQDRICNLKDGISKHYAILAIDTAQENLDAVREGVARVDALVEKGARDSVARFQRGAVSALDRPFPLIAVEKELKNIMDCLAGAFAAVDIGIGRIEETEGMACKDGHYWDLSHGALWEGGAGEQAWLDVLWPMRSLERLIISAQDTVHDAAYCVDSMRPKARSIIKKHMLVPGFQWEKEKEREGIAALASGNSLCKTVYAWGGERMEGQADSLCVAEDATLPRAKDGSGQEKGHGKSSLRKRLKIAEEKSYKMHQKGSLQERKGKIGEKQR